jgi:uncharacterized membrane protein YqgA involved in biofilm formation
MADLSLTTVLGGMLAVPCIVVITQGSDKATKIFAGVGVLLGVWIGLRRDVRFIADITSDGLFNVLAIMSLAIAIVLAVRHKQQVLSTLMITAGALLSLRALGIVS